MFEINMFCQRKEFLEMIEYSLDLLKQRWKIMRIISIVQIELLQFKFFVCFWFLFSVQQQESYNSQNSQNSTTRRMNISESSAIFPSCCQSFRWSIIDNNSRSLAFIVGLRTPLLYCSISYGLPARECIDCQWHQKIGYRIQLDHLHLGQLSLVSTGSSFAPILPITC